MRFVLFMLVVLIGGLVFVGCLDSFLAVRPPTSGDTDVEKKRKEQPYENVKFDSLTGHGRPAGLVLLHPWSQEPPR
jgi:hypothetical protein